MVEKKRLDALQQRKTSNRSHDQSRNEQHAAKLDGNRRRRMKSAPLTLLKAGRESSEVELLMGNWEGFVCSYFRGNVLLFIFMEISEYLLNKRF